MRERPDHEYEPVARSEQLAEGELLPVRTARGTRICLARVAGCVHALRDLCPHADFPLSEGAVLPGGILECVWHGAHFRLATGEVLRGPATDPAERFDVREAGGRILVADRRVDAGGRE